MIGAKYSNDYYYYNHNGKCICFKYNSIKRVKCKVLDFLKKEHQESKISDFLKTLGLKLNKICVSNRYTHYEII